MSEKALRFLIVDSNSVLHRAYHALPPLKTKRGEIVNAVYGFLLVFLKTLKEVNPDYVVSCFDVKGPTFRHQEFKKYKSKRPPAPDELYQQIEKIKEILQIFNIPIFAKPGYEADDLIGTIKTLLERKQIFPEPQIFILSGDLDLLQLVDEKTQVLTMKKGLTESILYSKERVMERYEGLFPSQLVDLRGLKGDPSDNIPGVPGIGEKTAIKLLKEFNTLENLYKEIEENSPRARKLIPAAVLKNLKSYKEQAFLSKTLAKIDTSVPLDFSIKECRFGDFDLKEVIRWLERYEFYTLLSRVQSLKKEAGFSKKQKDFLTKKLDKENSRSSVLSQIETLYKEGIFSKTIYETEKKLTEIIQEMERNGIFVEKECLKKLSQHLTKEITQLEQEIYALAGQPFNINSPAQLRKVLFEKLKITSYLVKKTPKGAISTNAQELEKIRKEHPIVEKILKYRESSKLKSGFVDRLIEFIDPRDGRIHPKFIQLGAETGRMACRDPNLQNIPTRGERGKRIRKCFRANPSFFLVSADYSQMELRVAAILSGDKKMKKIFQKGEDIHLATAQEIFSLSKEKITPEQRDLAKTLNFGILYGMGKKMLSERTGLSLSEAASFIKKYFEKFPDIAAYREKIIEQAKKQGFVETLFGRKRMLSEINSKDPRLRAQAERIAVNTKIQGTASDIIKMAMVRLWEEKIIDNECKLLLQIHDELIFEIKKDIVREKSLKIKQIMEKVVDFEIPFLVEIKAGENWGEIESLRGVG